MSRSQWEAEREEDAADLDEFQLLEKETEVSTPTMSPAKSHHPENAAGYHGGDDGDEDVGSGGGGGRAIADLLRAGLPTGDELSEVMGREVRALETYSNKQNWGGFRDRDRGEATPTPSDSGLDPKSGDVHNDGGVTEHDFDDADNWGQTGYSRMLGSTHIATSRSTTTRSGVFEGQPISRWLEGGGGSTDFETDDDSERSPLPAADASDEEHYDRTGGRSSPPPQSKLVAKLFKRDGISQRKKQDSRRHQKQSRIPGLRKPNEGSVGGGGGSGSGSGSGNSFATSMSVSSSSNDAKQGSEDGDVGTRDPVEADDLVQAKLAELEDQIAHFKSENSRIEKLRKQHEQAKQEQAVETEKARRSA
jgi:hypothetical protein